MPGGHDGPGVSSFARASAKQNGPNLPLLCGVGPKNGNHSHPEAHSVKSVRVYLTNPVAIITAFRPSVNNHPHIDQLYASILPRIFLFLLSCSGAM